MHWKLSSKARIASDFSTVLRASTKVKYKNDAIRNRIYDFAKATYFSAKTQ